MFLIFSWLFIATMFADGANLDDLIPGGVVLHDDEDAVSPPASGSDATNFSSSGAAPNRHFSVHLVPQNSRSASQPLSLRVMVDQDSPSLAPDVHPFFERISAIAGKMQSLLDRAPSGADDLYLRLRTLLI